MRAHAVSCMEERALPALLFFVGLALLLTSCGRGEPNPEVLLSGLRGTQEQIDVASRQLRERAKVDATFHDVARTLLRRMLDDTSLSAPGREETILLLGEIGIGDAESRSALATIMTKRESAMVDRVSAARGLAVSGALDADPKMLSEYLALFLQAGRGGDESGNLRAIAQFVVPTTEDACRTLRSGLAHAETARTCVGLLSRPQGFCHLREADWKTVLSELERLQKADQESGRWRNAIEAVKVEIERAKD